MRKILLASVALLALGSAAPSFAQEKATGAVVGGTAGAATGGTIGFFLGGPIGAIIGGFAGATIGASAGVSAASVEYASTHPVDPVIIDGDLDADAELSADVSIHDIEGDDQYGYVYANNRVYIVDKNNRHVVHSPGFVIPERTVAYVRDNPGVELKFSGDLAPGVTLSGDFDFNDVPDDPNYVYAYIDGRPVLVDRRSHVVVWVG
jgi:hypothetical protein